MKRFILITFGFMAWGFYELSGGDEFEPASARLEASVPVTQAELPNPATSEAETVAIAIVDTDPPAASEAAPAALDNAPLATVVQTAAEQPVSEISDTSAAVEQAISQDEPTLIIPSLITPSQPAATDDATQFASISDVRTVSGNRVNVRGGPGTDFGVVTRLGRGDEVEILQDNGDGWVRMRPLSGGPEGWMADFLLTSS